MGFPMAQWRCVLSLVQDISGGQALFAASIVAGDRSYWYTVQEILGLVASAVGPLVGCGMFFFLGDNWTLDEMKPGTACKALLTLRSVVHWAGAWLSDSCFLLVALR